MLPLLKEVFMIGKVYSAAVTGIYAVPVEVQADVAPGIPYFELTGNLAGTTKEAKERVRIAIKNSKFQINDSCQYTQGGNIL